jgi:ABC-type phosphate transport system permease subunit
VQEQSPPAFIVTVIEPPARQTTVADVIVGSLGLAGVLLLISLALGACVGAILVRWHQRHPPEQEHLPPVSPLVPDPGARPSIPTR